jgi:hypothetical protein
MRWLLLDTGLVVAAVVLLGATALRLWRKVGVATSAADELRDRIGRLNAETTALAGRLDAAEATVRLAQRSG